MEIKGINKLHKKLEHKEKEENKNEVITKSDEVLLLEEIRDLLKEN